MHSLFDGENLIDKLSVTNGDEGLKRLGIKSDIEQLLLVDILTLLTFKLGNIFACFCNSSLCSGIINVLCKYKGSCLFSFVIFFLSFVLFVCLFHAVI